MTHHSTGIPAQTSCRDEIKFAPSAHSRKVIRLRQKRMLHFDDVARPSNHCHVLVVHHRPDTLEMITSIFRKCGYYVTTACNNDEALISLNQKHFDLLFSDLDTPMLNGYHLALLIKKLRLPTKVVAMTGRCQAEIVDFVMEGTIDGWLFKPFKLKALIDLLIEMGLEPKRAGVKTGCQFHNSKQENRLSADGER